jgi:hypothetical protein
MPVKAPSIVSVLVVVLFGATMALMLLHPIALDANQTTMLNILLGALSTAFATVVNFWLGSSVGSKAKDQTISDLSKGAPNANKQ